MMTTMPIGHPFRRPAVWGELPRPLLLAPLTHRVGAPFAQDVVAAVDIGVQDRSITGAVPTASNARAREHWLLSTISLIGGQRVVVQERCLAGFALLPRGAPGSRPVSLCRSTAR